jgi:hypothetical protein
MMVKIQKILQATEKAGGMSAMMTMVVHMIFQ